MFVCSILKMFFIEIYFFIKLVYFLYDSLLFWFFWYFCSLNIIQIKKKKIWIFIKTFFFFVPIKINGKKTISLQNWFENFFFFFFLKNIFQTINLFKWNKFQYKFQKKNLKNFFFFNFNYFLNGVIFFWKKFRFFFLPLILITLIFSYTIIIRALLMNKVLFLSFSFFILFYWIISGFVFFIKKYRFSKYTSIIQRFWRRSYILFWLLESSLLFVFVYLMMVASQENFYMYDEIQIYKIHLFSWRVFFFKCFPLILLIFLNFFFLLKLKWNIFFSHSFWIIMFTVILTYYLWIEFYQFFHIISFYNQYNWLYDLDEKKWVLENEVRRTRIINHYILWLLILKFWHLGFIYLFWIFFVLRGLEKRQITHTLFSVNFQNFLILFFMNWIIMIPWFKFSIRKFFDLSFFWFYLTKKKNFFRYFFTDFYLYCTEYFHYHNFFNKQYFFHKISFFYWIRSNYLLIFFGERKYYIRNIILKAEFFNVKIIWNN